MPEDEASWTTLNVMFATTHPDNPGEAISREQAVIAYTRGSSYAEFAEREKGMLVPGMLADLAVLSQDVFTVALGKLPETTSVLTLVGGKVAYDAKALRASATRSRTRQHWSRQTNATATLARFIHPNH